MAVPSASSGSRAEGLQAPSAGSIGSGPCLPERPTAKSGSSAMHVHASAEESIGRWRPTVPQLLRRSRHLFPARAGPSSSPSSRSGSSATSTKTLQSGSPTTAEDPRWCCLLSRLKPESRAWLMDRLGTGEKAVIFIAFMVLNAAKYVNAEYAYNGVVNPFAGLVLANLASMTLALALSFFTEGRAALPKIFCWHSFWRLFVMAALFSTATFLTIRAYRTGLLSVIVELLGYTYMPISVGLSYCVFRRAYGKLEWLATAMMVLATVALLLLRERCHLADCHKLELWNPSRDVNALGISFVIGSVLVSVVASLLSERLYKSQSAGLIRTCGCLHEHSLPIMKVQLDFSSALVSSVFWTVSMSPFGSLVNGTSPPMGWFGDFSAGHALLVFVAAGQSWLAALVTKRFDTVIRSLVQTLSTVIAVCLFDPMQHDKWNFHRRWLPSHAMAGIVMVSALVFQTGRINLKTIRRSLHLPAYQDPPVATGGLGWRDSLASMLVFPFRRSEVARLSAAALEEGRAAEGEAAAQQGVRRRLVAVCLAAVKYSPIVLYVLADGFRTVLQSVALSETQNTPAVFVLIINACGLFLANGLTLFSNGLQGLRQSWNVWKVIHFLVCGFFFALTSTLSALAYAMGISPALSMVVGKFYTPMLAILSRWILGKFFLALEWFAIVILTLANIAYGGLQTMNEDGGKHGGQSVWATLVPALCVLGSAMSSCINTLLMERLMTGEEKLPSGEPVPYHMQKVRLDAGTVLWAALFLPAMGLVAQGPGSEKFAFWKERPLTAECSRLGTCQDGTFLPSDPSDANLPSCACGGGLFVGWDTSAMYLALAVNVFYSWITGIVVVRFSSIYRAIADAFSLALVYFVLQPMLMSGTWDNSGLDMMAVLIPLSALTFSFSANEMQKVMQLVAFGSSDKLGSQAEEQEQQDGLDFDSFESIDGSEDAAPQIHSTAFSGDLVAMGSASTRATGGAGDRRTEGDEGGSEGKSVGGEVLEEGSETRSGGSSGSGGSGDTDSVVANCGGTVEVRSI